MSLLRKSALQGTRSDGQAFKSAVSTPEILRVGFPCACLTQATQEMIEQIDLLQIDGMAANVGLREGGKWSGSAQKMVRDTVAPLLDAAKY